ncbi:MAG TPA: TRIC cation channel family protein, partial [Actinomycetales bacterium]|nr:TRIC cation channel family protein [Actinomycetales bacterium]
MVLVAEVAAPTLPLEPILELVGVFAFALSGGLAAVRKNFDIIGALVLAWCAGLGGGVLRDVLIGDVPPIGITEIELFGTAAAAGVITMLFHPAMARIWRFIIVLDAVGLGLFAVQGATKALDMETGFLAAVIVGVLTGVGGGMLRD